MELIKVFYSAPEDQGIAKFRPIFEEVKDDVGRILDVHFETLYWRQMAGGLSDTGGQAVIDRRVEGNYDIYFGLMGSHFGSGTEHEYRKAVQDHINTGSPIDAFFGFLDEPVRPHSLNLDSFGPVVEFKKDIATPAKYGKAIFYFTFADEREFRQAVQKHLAEAANVIKGRVAGGRSYGAASPHSSP